MENSIFLEKPSCARIEPYGVFAMKEKINKLARGIVDQEKPSTHFSLDFIEGKIPLSESKTFEVFIQSLNGIPMRGLVYCKEAFVTLHKNAFGGVRTKVGFTVNTEGMEEEKELFGELNFVYLGGEKQIPYHFVLEKSPSSAKIDSLKDFSALRKLYETDKKAAVRLFDYRDFYSAPLMKKKEAEKLYEMLKPCGNRAVALEEFLAYFSERPRNGLARQSLAFSPEKKEEEQLDFPSGMSLEEKIKQCIRRGERGEEAFSLYKKGVEENLKLTKLYENLLYSMKKGYKEELPRAVYLYFSYEYRVEEGLRSALYYNILQNFQENSDIYLRFARQIKDYTVESFLMGKMDEELAFLYKKLILPDMVDERMAEILPRILRSYKIVVEDKEIEKLVLSHPALKGEEVYTLTEGEAYLPMPYRDMILLFQDAMGNRYTRVNYRKTKVFEGSELAKKLEGFSDSDPHLLVERAVKLEEEGIRSEEELELMEKVFRTTFFSTAFRMEVLKCILSYHRREKNSTFHEENLQFLYQIPVKAMNREEREDYLAALLLRGKMDLALSFYKENPYLRIDKELLSDFADAAYSLGEENIALSLSYAAFREHAARDKALELLLEKWNGSSAEMYSILKRGEKRREEKGEINASHLLNMAERLLAQCLFTEKRRETEEAFSLYRKFSGNETTLVKAFLTAYASSIFLYQKKENAEFTKLLYEVVRGEGYKERVPLILLLALSYSFSKRESLTEDETELLKSILPFLLEKNYIFAYTVHLAKFVPLPKEILEKTVVEYHGKAEERPYFSVRMQGEKDFHREELQHSYHGIYTASFLLFPGESMEYRFTLGKEEKLLYESVLRKDGSLETEGEDSYTALCRMSKLLMDKDIEKLRPLMEDYEEKELALSRVLED